MICCLQCGHKWANRKKQPISCPRCKRYDHDKPPRSNHTNTETTQLFNIMQKYYDNEQKD